MIKWLGMDVDPHPFARSESAVLDAAVQIVYRAGEGGRDQAGIRYRNAPLPEGAWATVVYDSGLYHGWPQN